jgi:hypothetical protein
MQYKVEVLVGNDPWCGNQLTFDTIEKAKKYGNDLFSRWLAVKDWHVIDNNNTVVYTTEETS